MKINDKIHGFTVKDSQNIERLHATVYIAEHEKSGARLAFIDRADNNKTFAIGFKTPAFDSTGVFHIIEHSVLCGSRKFPVKEPFVELLKGSLNTFLNAMTYEDRTVYPVSSRCDKDFYNLTDIYLDAVFHPLMLENENIFLQEGWHYEYDEEGDTLSYNGVVYNEMKGAYSSPDDLGTAELSKALFPDNNYSKDSGGCPDNIPELTYEGFKAAHKKYYHPSNSYIILDGSVNLDEILPLIDSYLSEYERCEIKAPQPIHPAHTAHDVTVEFEANDESGPGARVILGYAYTPFENRFDAFDISLISKVISSTNDSALKLGMLESGLCEDIVMNVYRGRQIQISFELLGVEEAKIGEAVSKLKELIEKIANDGIDKKRLVATLNNIAFRLKENDYGALPAGVAYALGIFPAWMYGMSIADEMRFDDLLESAHKKAEGDYFDKLLLDITLKNAHSAKIIMLPRRDFGAKISAKLSETLKKARIAMSDDDLLAILAKYEALRAWQQTPDTEEKLSTLPTLTLDDITIPKKDIKTEVSYIGKAKVLRHSVRCVGITRVELHFAADDLDDRELYLLSLLTTVLKNLPTENYTASELQSELRSNLGSLATNTTVFPMCDGSGDGKITFSVTASALDERRTELVSLIKEILLHTRFTDADVVKKRLVQVRRSMEEMFASDGLTFAMSRIAASNTKTGAADEILSGYDSYIKTKEYIDSFDGEVLLSELSELLSRLACQSRLTLAVSGDDTDALVENIVSLFTEGSDCTAIARLPRATSREGIAVPSRVAYAVAGALAPKSCDMLGVMRVVRSILCYDYLWSNIRVKGGAYGTGFTCPKSGEIGFYSYRDPSPAASLECYKGAPNYLRELAKSNTPLTNFIIGAIGEYDILTTPRIDAVQATYNAMTGWTPEHDGRVIRQMLDTDGAALIAAADVIEDALNRAGVCIAADRDTLSDKKLSPLTILEI